VIHHEKPELEALLQNKSMKWSFIALNPNNVFYIMKMKVQQGRHIDGRTVSLTLNTFNL
jgi:hypothetical protein